MSNNKRVDKEMPRGYYWFLGRVLDSYGEPAYRISNVYKNIKDIRRAILYDIVKDNNKSSIQVVNVFPDRVMFDIIPANDNLDAYNNTTGNGEYIDNKLVVLARVVKGYMVMDFYGNIGIMDKDSLFREYTERSRLANVYVYRRGDGKVIVSPRKGEDIVNLVGNKGTSRSKRYRVSEDVSYTINKVNKYRNDGLLTLEDEQLLDKNEYNLYKKLADIRSREQQYNKNDIVTPDMGVFAKEVRQLSNIELKVETGKVYEYLRSVMAVYKDVSKQVYKTDRFSKTDRDGSLDRLMLRIGEELKNLKHEANRENISDAEIIIRLKSIRHTLGEVRERCKLSLIQ